MVTRLLWNPASTFNSSDVSGRAIIDFDFPIDCCSDSEIICNASIINIVFMDHLTQIYCTVEAERQSDVWDTDKYAYRQVQLSYDFSILRLSIMVGSRVSCTRGEEALLRL